MRYQTFQKFRKYDGAIKAWIDFCPSTNFLTEWKGIQMTISPDFRSLLLKSAKNRSSHIKQFSHYQMHNSWGQACGKWDWKWNYYLFIVQFLWAIQNRNILQLLSPLRRSIYILQHLEDCRNEILQNITVYQDWMTF